MGNTSSRPLPPGRITLPNTYYEDYRLWELYWCRVYQLQEEYFKKQNICGVKCTVSKTEQRPLSLPAARVSPPIKQPRRSSSDEELEKQAILFCCMQREEERRNECTCGYTYPSYLEDYMEATSGIVRNKRKKRPVRPLPVIKRLSSPKCIPATEIQRKCYWKKYFPRLPQLSRSSESPELTLQAALNNTCTNFCKRPDQLPTVQNYSDLMQCPPVEDVPTWTLRSSSPQYPDFRCPRLSFELAPSHATVGQPAGHWQTPHSSPQTEVKSVYTSTQRPMNYQNVFCSTQRGVQTYTMSTGGPPPISSAVFNKYPGSQQVTSTLYHPSHSPPQQVIVPQVIMPHVFPTPHFLDSLDVGAAEPTNVSVIIYSNNIMIAQVKGFSPQMHNQIKSTITKRWVVPFGVHPESIYCFLGNGKLVIVTVPLPLQFYQQYDTRNFQVLGPALRIPCTYPSISC